MIKTPILIVGAGPSGLMLSAQLARFDVDHVIVDQKPGITKLSKALGIQARSMEQFAQLGVVDQVLDQGFVARQVEFYVDGISRARVMLGDIGKGLSPFPYMFVLEQSKTERVLFEHLQSQNLDVCWQTKVSQIERSGSGYRGQLVLGDGSIEPFECDYLVGCDGAGSVVRHFMETPFEGSTSDRLFFVADVFVSRDMPKQGLMITFTGEEFLAFFPMAEEGQFRAVGVLPHGHTDPDNVSQDLIAEAIEKRSGLGMRVERFGWHSGYKVHHRVARQFAQDQCFLVGDAAHIHSPAGGQGMNTGLGDAVNLGWKLAAMVKGWSTPDLLNSYEQERKPFALQLVHSTDRVFGFMVSESGFWRFVRTKILPIALNILLRFDKLKTLLFQTVSQTRINYRGSSVSNGSGVGSLKSGDRFPYFEWEGGNSFEWLAAPGFVCLNLGETTDEVTPPWGGQVTEIEVPPEALESAIHAGLPAQGRIIVRPDMHILTVQC